MALKGDNEETTDLHFPKAGIDHSSMFGKQPARQIIGGEWARTTVIGNNVRGFDPVTNRVRGASRMGLSKWVNARPGDQTYITQELNVISTTGIDAPGGGVAQQSISGRVVTLIAVSQGTIYVANSGDTSWTTPTNNTGETPALNITGQTFSAQNNQKMYFCDGINYAYYNPKTNTVEAWTATAGELPKDEDNNVARLICTWRGRTVLSGIIGDPQNWFMSRVSDPHDYDYAPQSPAADDAVAGNNSPLGFIGDLVTALIPYNDDILVFGGDHTIYMMRGDPADGGQIDLISDAIGIAWGEAWCKDPYGNVYFFSNRCGVYRMVPGEQPVRISQGIEQILDDIDTGTNIIRMAWNDQFQGFHIFVTDASQPQPTQHFFFEARTGAWWTDSFADDNMNPIALVAYDGNLPDDRRLLIGSWDGFVREVDPDAEDDDGVDIEGDVYIGPIVRPTGDEMLLHEIQGIMAENSGDVTWAVHVGNTAEAAIDAEPVASGTWASSRNLNDIVRYAGHAIYIRLTSTVPWAMESITARVSAHGKVRRRGY